MIDITDKAKKEALRLLEAEQLMETGFIRVGVDKGGCSGLSYELKFDTKLNADDHEMDRNGLKVVVNKKALVYLAGTTIDYSDGLNGKGFYFDNPNASRTCNCGDSFSV